MAPKLKIRSVDVPLVLVPEGVVRVRGTRIPIETIVYAYRNGQTPEEMHIDYPTLQLPDIYAVIAYYLQWQEEVDQYVKEWEIEAERIRSEMLAIWPQEGLREKLLARREQQQAQRNPDAAGS